MTYAQQSGRRFQLAVLSAFSALLAIGSLFLRWPLKIPSAFSARLWFVHILQPIAPVTAGSPNIAHAVPMETAWWPFALGIALFLVVLVAATRNDRSARRLISLVALGLSLAGAAAAEIYYARAGYALYGEYGSLALALVINALMGGALIGLALGITERMSGMSRRTIRLVRALLVAAGIGFASFVLSPLAAIPLAIALLSLSYGFTAKTLGPSWKLRDHLFGKS